MGVHEPMTGAQRQARHRAAMRAKGLRPRQIWIPDLSNPRVRAEIERSAAAINRSDRESGIMRYLETLSDEMMTLLEAPEQDDERAT